MHELTTGILFYQKNVVKWGDFVVNGILLGKNTYPQLCPNFSITPILLYEKLVF